MPAYTYSAMNEMGRTMRGTIAAENDIDLESRLKEIGLDLISFKEVRERKAGFTSKVQDRDMLLMCLHMEQLDRAGVPIHEALQDVRDSTESLKLRDVVTDLTERVRGGEPLSKAMSAYPKVFSNIFVGLVRAGEKNGNMTESFVHMTNHMKWSTELKRKVRKAIAYPIVLLVVMSIVIAVLMVAVVPKLIDFIVSQGFEIPLHTHALIWTSELFEEHWYLILGLPVATFVGLRILYAVSEPTAYFFDSIFIRVPVIGKTIVKINLARFTHFFAIMFKSGIDILEALDASKHVVNNRVLKEAINTAIRSVTEGNSLTASLRMSSHFPNLVIRMFKVGEDSGNMNEALENVNFFYHREVNDSVDAMIGMIQPTLTAVMGGLIFWVIAAVFGPLYQSFENMNF